MKSTRMLGLSIVTLLLASMTLVADTEAADAAAQTPEAVAERALAALKEDRLADFTALMHPDALQGMRKMMLEIVDAAEAAGEGGDILTLFQGVQTVEALHELDDRAFFLAFLDGIMNLQPSLRTAMGGMDAAVLGHVPEGADVAHVVYRGSITLEGISVSKMSVISLRADGDTWRLLLTGEIAGIAQALKQRFEPAPAP